MFFLVGSLLLWVLEEVYRGKKTLVDVEQQTSEKHEYGKRGRMVDKSNKESGGNDTGEMGGCGAAQSGWSDR